MHYYLLLYKIKSSPFIWIVKREQHYDDLLNRIDKLRELETYTSNVDEYYIVRQNNCEEKEIEDLLELQQFTLFKLDTNSELLFRSE